MQFVILVAVIVALLLSSFLLFTFTYSSFSQRSETLITHINGANTGIDYFLRNNWKSGDSLELSIEKITVKLKSSFWGGLQIVLAEAGEETTSFKKAALISTGSVSGQPSIYLEDNQMPLVLAGEARVEGDVYIPDELVKSGSVGGFYYKGEQLIYGTRHPSSTKLPSLEDSWRSYSQRMLNFVPGPKHLVIEQGDLKNSFFEEEKVIYRESTIILANQLSGNIIIKSLDEIVVEPWAQLEQTLLIAPRVLLKKGFSGSLHVIAEKIIVEEEVWLHYPSSLIVPAQEGLLEKDYDYEPKIEIGKQVLFQGDILYLTNSLNHNSKRDIVLEEDAMVEGSIYCEGYTEIKGTVKGTIYTQFFSAYHDGSLYINHILDGKVLPQDIKGKISGPPLEGRQKQVAAWLY